MSTLKLKSQSAETASHPPSPVSLSQAFWYWLKLGFISFGGPAGQIAIMHQDLVEKNAGSPNGVIFTRSITVCCCPAPKHSNWPSISAG